MSLPQQDQEAGLLPVKLHRFLTDLKLATWFEEVGIFYSSGKDILIYIKRYVVVSTDSIVRAISLFMVCMKWANSVMSWG